MPSPTTETTQSTQSAPWGPTQAGLNRVIRRSNRVATADRFRPEQGATTQNALGQMTQIAQQGSAAIPALQSVVSGSGEGYATGLGELQKTALGDYYGSNPHFQAAIDAAANRTANDVNQQFSAAGRYGSAAHAGTLADRIGELRTSAGAQQYEAERARQLAAATPLYQSGYQGAQLAGELDRARTWGADLLGRVGGQEDAFALANKQAPLNAVEWQANLLRPIGALGGTQSMTGTSTVNNPLGTAIGIGSTALGLLGGGGGFGLGGLF